MNDAPAQELAPADVFVLGAGFSKAICERMPLMDELGDQVWVQLGQNKPDLPPNMQGVSETMNLEQLLTYLIEDHPWDQRHIGFERRAHFERIARLIIANVTNAEAEAKRTNAPTWLGQLLEHWDINEAMSSHPPTTHSSSLPTAQAETADTRQICKPRLLLR